MKLEADREAPREQRHAAHRAQTEPWRRQRKAAL